MYPYPPQRSQDDEPTMIDVRGVLPGQRPAVDAAVLEEPTSEVPVIGAEEIEAVEAVGDEPRPGQYDPADHDPDSEPTAETATAEPATAADVEAVESFGDPDDAPGPRAGVYPQQPADETETTVQSPHSTQAETTQAETPQADASRAYGSRADGPQAGWAELATTPASTPPITAAFSASPTTPPATPASGSRAPGDIAESRISLWSDEAIDRLRGQWKELQGEFIDDPEETVTSAKSLVTEAVRELADTLLEAQDALDPFQGDEPVDTEAMRVAMRQYREFLDRVLAL